MNEELQNLLFSFLIHSAIFMRWKRNVSLVGSELDDREFMLLKMLHDYPNHITERGAANFFGLNSISMSRVLKKLSDDGLIKKDNDHLTITQTGEQSLDKEMRLLAGRFSSLVEGMHLTDEERALLAKVEAGLTKYIDVNVIGV